MKFTNIAIIAAKRTAIGKFCGSLSNFPAHMLGAEVVKSLLNFTKNKIKKEEITELIAGQALTAETGQNPARQAAVQAGLPFSMNAFTVNHMCGSGLKTVGLAACQIMLERNAIIIAGGQENMSMAPYTIKLRQLDKIGHKIGDYKLVDSLLHDGLIDAFRNYHMGVTAENLAKKYSINREDQDEFAYSSHIKAIAAQGRDQFAEEIVPIMISQGIISQGDSLVEATFFEKDEGPRANISLNGLEKLKSAFQNEGSVTAGNSSSLNDGAAFLILMDAHKAKEKNLEILANIVSCAQAGVEPEIMGVAPVYAIRKALNAAGWKIEELELIELNEAFAAQALAVIRELDLDIKKININGGAIALGHPIGASGARCLVTLIHNMKKAGATKGLVTLCIGGGMSIAMCIERTVPNKNSNS